MSQRPDWLPDIVGVDGEWVEVLSRLYQIFETDFIKVQRSLGALPVCWDIHVLPGGKYEEGFWHLISKDDKETKERLFDPRRAERLPWCGPTISHFDEIAVKVWVFKEPNKRLRTYLWLENWDYTIILEKRGHIIGPVAFLVTAFFVEGESTRRNLLKKYEKREGVG